MDLFEKAQKEFLNISEWNYIHITYEYPHVERLWKQIEDGRLFLHCFEAFPVEINPLFHPHYWSSKTKIVSGSYLMDIGAIIDGKLTVLAKEILCLPGSGYIMDNPHGWHSVTPLEKTYTIMHTKELYDSPLEFPIPENPGEKLPLTHPKAQKYLQEWERIFQI